MESGDARRPFCSRKTLRRTARDFEGDGRQKVQEDAGGQRSEIMRRKHDFVISEVFLGHACGD